MDSALHPWHGSLGWLTVCVTSFKFEYTTIHKTIPQLFRDAVSLSSKWHFSKHPSIFIGNLRVSLALQGRGGGGGGGGWGGGVDWPFWGPWPAQRTGHSGTLRSSPGAGGPGPGPCLLGGARGGRLNVDILRVKRRTENNNNNNKANATRCEGDYPFASSFLIAPCDYRLVIKSGTVHLDVWFDD